MKILAFLLALLKILGIVLLCIILTLIVLLAVILLVRIKYNIVAEKSDTLFIDFEATWFLKIVYFRYRLSDKGKKIILKIFGKSFYKDREIFQKEEKKLNKSEVDSYTREPKTNIEKEYNNTVTKHKSEPKTKKQKEHKVDKEIKKVVKDEVEKIEKEVEDDIEKYPVIDRIKQIWHYPDREDIQYLTIKLVRKLCKVLFPKELYLDIEFGSDNPAQTGYVLALSSILVLYFGNNVKVQGNFEKKVLDGKLKSKGSFALGQIVWALLIFVLKKPIRKIIWHYIKHRKEE